jgi:hypothetical protein
MFFHWRNGRGGCRTIAEFCEGLTGKEKFLFRRSAWARLRAVLAITIVVRAIVEIAPRTAPVVTAAISTILVVTAILAIATLRRSIFRRRQISAAWTRTSATAPSTSAAPTAASTTISAAVIAAISAMEIAASTAALIRPIIKAGRRIVLRRVVLRREILGRRFIRIGLALIVKLLSALGKARLNVFGACMNFFDMRANLTIFRIGVTILAGCYGVRRFTHAAEGLARKNEVCLRFTAFRRSRCGMLVPVTAMTVAKVAVTVLVVAVVIAFEIFEDVTDVQKCVSVEANVHESGLHSWKNASDFSFVDAADEGELFFALDVDFD